MEHHHFSPLCFTNYTMKSHDFLPPFGGICLFVCLFVFFQTPNPSKSKGWKLFCFLPGGDGEERGFEKVYLLWVLSQRIHAWYIYPFSIGLCQT